VGAFIALLLAPIPDEAHTGIARAILASRFRFTQDDLGFLRRMVCCRSATSSDFARLTALVEMARDRVA